MTSKLCFCIRALDKGSLVSSMCKRDLVKGNHGYTQCVIDCGPQNPLQIRACVQIQADVPLCCVVLSFYKLYLSVCALIFYVCEGLSQPIANRLNMQKNYGIDIFDYEGHNL